MANADAQPSELTRKSLKRAWRPRAQNCASSIGTEYALSPVLRGVGEPHGWDMMICCYLARPSVTAAPVRCSSAYRNVRRNPSLSSTFGVQPPKVLRAREPSNACPQMTVGTDEIPFDPNVSPRQADHFFGKITQIASTIFATDVYWTYRIATIHLLHHQD